MLKRSYLKSSTKPLKRTGIKRKPPKKKAKKEMTVAHYKNKIAWPAFSKFIRYRDCIRTTGLKHYGECISCKRIIPRKLGNAGHFIPGRHNANLFYERGVHHQCVGCNDYLKGNTLPYMDALINLYGLGIIEELRHNERKYLKFTLEGLKEKVKVWRKKTKEFENHIDCPINNYTYENGEERRIV